MAGRIDCARFQAAMGDYLAGLLGGPQRASLAEHALSCKACRSLLDDVKSKLDGADPKLEASCELEAALEKIPEALVELNCEDFQGLISDFLDGFVPAPTYHRFVAHSACCKNCSDLLTDVVYAVAACHLVHVYEELDVPKSLIRRLIEIAPERSGLIFRIWPRAAAAILVALILVGALRSSFQNAMADLYKAAQIKVVKLYSRGAELYYRRNRAPDQGPKAANRKDRRGAGIAIFGTK
jgi:predicted anti-sigma-YlaC factor YlaD